MGIRSMIFLFLLIILGWGGYTLFQYCSSITSARSVEQSGENYQAEDYYNNALNANFEKKSQQEFVDFVENFEATEGVDLQKYMTPKMLVALGSHRQGFETAEANYSDVANKFFINNSTRDFEDFCQDCQKTYGVDLHKYLDEAHAQQLR